MKAKVLSVYDEGAIEDTPLIGAKGISILVDVDGERTLFDVGMRGRYLIHNLEHLGIEPDSIDRVVISHCHRGNYGGLWKLLDVREEPLEVCADPSFLALRKVFGRSMFTDEQGSKMMFRELTGITGLSKHLSIIGPFGDVKEFSLVMDALKGPVVITSCCHSGVGQVLSETRSLCGRNPYHLVGGIHLRKLKRKDVDPVADAIAKSGTPKMTLGHCTGPEGMMHLRVRFKFDGVMDFFVGTEIDFEV